jgi:streptogramin lyase
VHRPKHAKGALDLEVDPDGNFWLSLMYQTGVAKFDRKTETFRSWPLPEGTINEESQQSMVGPQRWTVDGKVWLNDAGIPGMHRLDMTTGTFETWKPYQNVKGPHSVYGIYADSQNNIFFNDFGGENVGKIDATSGKVTLYPTPTPRSRPRRGRMDAQDRLWFAEWRAEKIGMFDTRSEKFQEWTVPTPYTAPYDVVVDKNGEVWMAGMNTDRITRFDLETGKFTEYPLPSSTNIRRVFVDNSTSPVTFWVGNNHGASIVRLEPLD